MFQGGLGRGFGYCMGSDFSIGFAKYEVPGVAVSGEYMHRWGYGRGIFLCPAQVTALDHGFPLSRKAPGSVRIFLDRRGLTY